MSHRESLSNELLQNPDLLLESVTPDRFEGAGQVHLRMPASAGGKKGTAVIGVKRKANFGCGCVPPGKSAERKTKNTKPKSSAKKR